MVSASDSENRNCVQGVLTRPVIYPNETVSQMTAVFTTDQLLARLSERGIRNSAVAQVLQVHPSRVTEMRKGLRSIKLDEAARLVEAFDLEAPPSRPAPALPAPVARLLVRYIAAELGFPLEEASHQLAELAEDVRAFVEYAGNQKGRGSVEATEAFFEALRLRRPSPLTADQ